jgi:hypothetical protein
MRGAGYKRSRQSPHLHRGSACCLVVFPVYLVLFVPGRGLLLAGVQDHRQDGFSGGTQLVVRNRTRH